MGRQAGLQTGYKLRLLHVWDYQPVLGRGNGRIEKSCY